MNVAGNWSQRMDRRLPPKRFSMPSSWRTVRAVLVLPIPSTPMRAIGVGFLPDQRSFRPARHVQSSPSVEEVVILRVC